MICSAGAARALPEAQLERPAAQPRLARAGDVRADVAKVLQERRAELEPAPGAGHAELKQYVVVPAHGPVDRVALDDRDEAGENLGGRRAREEQRLSAALALRLERQRRRDWEDGELAAVEVEADKRRQEEDRRDGEGDVLRGLSAAGRGRREGGIRCTGPPAKDEDDERAEGDRCERARNLPRDWERGGVGGRWSSAGERATRGANERSRTQRAGHARSKTSSAAQNMYASEKKSIVKSHSTRRSLGRISRWRTASQSGRATMSSSSEMMCCALVCSMHWSTPARNVSRYGAWCRWLSRCFCAASHGVRAVGRVGSPANVPASASRRRNRPPAVARASASAPSTKKTTTCRSARWAGVRPAESDVKVEPR